MSFTPPERFNMVDYFLEARLLEGKGARPAILTDSQTLSYAQVREAANRFGNLLREGGVQPEQRVMIALPDIPEYVAALFGALKIGAAAVMVNPGLSVQEIEYFLTYTRAVALVTRRDTLPAFEAARAAVLERSVRGSGDGLDHLRAVLVVDDPGFSARLTAASPRLETYPTHRDDAAIWLFSGGTTGHPKAVLQTHASYANSTECYARNIIGYVESDVTLSVPKLFFGYATGSNLLFPFAAGASSVLYPERCTVDVLWQKIERFRPSILVNVPTMVNRMVSDPRAAGRDLSSLRLVTSAGEALPAELHRRWDETFGVELLDGLGTAEMWHIFISNRPGDVRPGTLGKAVPGFDVRVCDEEGRELPAGETGWLWVRGGSRALGYWQQMERTQEAFRGEWYVSGDMLRRDEEGYFTYCGRGDDMLKVSGKWLAPGEVESRLLQHPGVKEAAVVGVTDEDGLTKPHAYVVLSRELADTGLRDPTGLEAELQAFVREGLAAYKYPRRIVFLDDLPRTHLGKVDRGAIRRGASR